jgi:hypothetical protein
MPPPRSGQLADYYRVIAQAVNRLGHSTAETRQRIYDRARAAMVAKLRSVTPSLSESDISREQWALERAIRKVETGSLRPSRTPPQPSTRQPDPPLGPIRETGDEQAEWRRSSIVILANDEGRASDDLAFAKKLAVNNPDLGAELEILQKKIRPDRHGSLMILLTRKFAPITIMGLLVLSVAASGAY